MGLISLSSLNKTNKKKRPAVLGKGLSMDLSKLTHTSLPAFGTWSRSTCFISEPGRAQCLLAVSREGCSYHGTRTLGNFRTATALSPM